jgi:hypothetical protein
MCKLSDTRFLSASKPGMGSEPSTFENIESTRPVEGRLSGANTSTRSFALKSIGVLESASINCRSYEAVSSATATIFPLTSNDLEFITRLKLSFPKNREIVTRLSWNGEMIFTFSGWLCSSWISPSFQSEFSNGMVHDITCDAWKGPCSSIGGAWSWKDMAGTTRDGDLTGGTAARKLRTLRFKRVGFVV